MSEKGKFIMVIGDYGKAMHAYGREEPVLHNGIGKPAHAEACKHWGNVLDLLNAHFGKSRFRRFVELFIGE